MTWVEIDLPAPELTAKDDGVVEWNSALQLLMGDPNWVDLMYNAADNTLGVRGVNSATGFPVVAEPEGSEYKIDSAAAIDAAGITISETTTAEPEKWHQTQAGGPGEIGWFGYNPIYYITLP